MTTIKSDSNQEISLSDREWLAGRLDHIDEGIHAIQRDLLEIVCFIEENRDAIARAKSLMDPGAKLRKALGVKPKGENLDHSH